MFFSDVFDMKFGPEALFAICAARLRDLSDPLRNHPQRRKL